jgi:hypothetical protein
MEGSKQVIKNMTGIKIIGVKNISDAIHLI